MGWKKEKGITTRVWGVGSPPTLNRKRPKRAFSSVRWWGSDESETHLEGSYWLALIIGRAFPVPEIQVHASDQFEAGWLVVKARWFEIVTTSPRCYRLQWVERLLVVNEMIRLPGLKFDKTVRSSPRLGHALFYLGEDMHNLLEGCVRDQKA